MRSAFALATLLVSSAFVVQLSAQVPAGFWGAYTGGSGAGATCGSLENGTSLGVLPFASGSSSPIPLLGFSVIMPPCVSKHMGGFVITSDYASMRLYASNTVVATFPIPFTFGGAAGLVISPIGQHAVTPSGDLWIVTGTVPATVTRFSLLGTAQAVANLGFVPGFVQSDPFGDCWVAKLNSNLITKIDSSGNAIVPTRTLPIGPLISIAVNPAGELWLLAGPASAAGTPTLLRLDGAGNTLLSLSVQGAAAMSLDVCGRPHVLRATNSMTGTQALAIDVRESVNGNLVKTLSLNGFPSANPTPLGSIGLTVDTRGNCWVRDAVGSALDAISPDGALISSSTWCGATGSVANSPMNGTGDPAGVHLVSVIDRGGDADGDGVANDREIGRGSDPFDATSVPIVPFTTTPLANGLPLTLATALPTDVGLPYIYGLALGSAGIPLLPSDCRTIPLSIDPLFDAWFTLVAPNISGASGTVPPGGLASMTLPIPSTPLGGIPITIALVTLNATSTAFTTLTDPLALVLP